MLFAFHDNEVWALNADNTRIGRAGRRMFATGSGDL